MPVDLSLSQILSNPSLSKKHSTRGNTKVGALGPGGELKRRVNNRISLRLSVIHKVTYHIMDGLQLRDEAVRDRIRAAEEFLDPSMLLPLDCDQTQSLMF
jgi:hypothetical protein